MLKDLIENVFTLPVPTLLIIVGAVCIILAGIGKIPGKLEHDKTGRIILVMFGIVFFVLVFI